MQDSYFTNLMTHRDSNGQIFDYLYCRCRDVGHTDPEFIEAARFGAKCLNDRLVGDKPYDIRQFYNNNSYCTIWRDTNQKPREGSTIVFMNGATIFYGFYQAGMVYSDGVQDKLSSMCGRWCYKGDLFGVSEDDVPYIQ